MDITTKRFSVKSDGFGNATIRDRNAPYHCHSVRLSELPSLHKAQMMTESQFDRAVSDAIYN